MGNQTETTSVNDRVERLTRTADLIIDGAQIGPTFSPDTAKRMSDMADQLRAAAADCGDPTAKAGLMEYALSLEIASQYSMVVCLAALTRFQKLVEADK